MSNLDRFKGSLIPTLYFIQSSNVIGVGYDKEKQDLYVMFGNKKVYKYSDVPDQTFHNFYDSPSKGKYLASNIKNVFECKESYKTDGYLVTDYKETKIVITDLDDGRGYIYINGVRHDMFDASPQAKKTVKDLKKCHICGNIDYEDARNSLNEEEYEQLNYDDKLSELTTCSYCEKPVCEQDGCREEFNDGDQCGCKECIEKWTLYDCSKCKTEDDECPFNREYATCYECPDYTEGEKQ